MLALALAAAMPLAWEGRAVVHAGGRKVEIVVRSRIEGDGTVISESWPAQEGEARGLRRLVLTPAGTGTLARGGATTPLEAAFVAEELAQFAFYQQLQIAANQCGAQTQTGPGSNVIEVYSPGATATAFRCEWNRITNAANWVRAAGKPIRQDFRIVGRLHSGTRVFPRLMQVKRDGKPFFDLRVTRFFVP